MDDFNASRFILHVSDFHLTNDTKELEHAKKALEALAKKLKAEGIKVDYLVHTGDVIDSSDLYEKVALELSYGAEYFEDKLRGEKTVRKFKFDEFEKSKSIDEKEVFNKKLKVLVEERFAKAEEVIRRFISMLNISLGSVIICCGNHDALRLLSVSEENVSCTKCDDGTREYSCSPKDEEAFQPFEDFLDRLEVANSRARCGQDKTVTHCVLDNLKILILNTNWKNPKNQTPRNYYCVRCDQVQNAINALNDNKKSCDTLNVVLAHKPIYEICETARLSYKRYIKTPFMAALQGFIGEKGIYLCGDKHTRSIVGSSFHDISHYIGGEPLTIATGESEVEYNLLEVSKSQHRGVSKLQLGMERKVHLSRSSNSAPWKCELRPQDDVVSKLYELSRKYIVKETFEMFANSKSFVKWESLAQEIYSWGKTDRKNWNNNLNSLYQAICKYRICGLYDTPLDDKNIFLFVRDRIIEQMSNASSKNVINIRGEYSSGKSTFLGLFCIFLLYQYSIGLIDFVPVYFNLESNEIFTRIDSEGSYYKAVKQAFADFTKNVQSIADKEHQPICYIIDGLDEQDCWSYSTEDSVGRGLLDVLARYGNASYIMSFSQHRLPRFKNTMPARKYNDTSDIMYFNPIDVQEKGSEDKRFISFVEAFLKLKKFPEKSAINKKLVETECDIIRNFRRLTINPGFMNHNYDYIVATTPDNKKLLHKDASVKDIYKYYIDCLYELCLDRLGYGFVTYAPAMAFLFSYKGYTYEKFEHLRMELNLSNQHTLKPICENHDKVYHTFLFIKKQKDAREYLIALQYNKELRYYAEHPEEDIEENSILNEFITRNIAVLIRKLWTDTNKFVIVCEQLLQREKLSNCVQSMLIYCLAHLPVYEPIRDQLREKMQKKAEAILLKQNFGNDPSQWKIDSRDNSQKLTQFLNLSLKHSLKVFALMDTEDSVELVNALIQDRAFCEYNRQYQMLYYGDLAIQGEDKRRSLNPGRDVVYKGFDFHNCFNYLYVKLSSGKPYPLRDFDMFTMCDLLNTRLQTRYVDDHIERGTYKDTFFYRDLFRKKALIILEQAKSVIDPYVSNLSDRKAPLYSCFKEIQKVLKVELEKRNDGK